MIVYGIDPSLTATGIARVDTDDRLVVECQTLTSTGKSGATLARRRERLNRLTDQVYGALWNPPDLIVIEAPSLGQARQGGQLDRHGLWWMLVDALIDHVTLVAVTPAQRAKYATGRGNAGKDEVLLAVARRYPHAEPQNNNEADALVLAAMGARLLGEPIEEHLPKANLSAMDKVERP